MVLLTDKILAQNTKQNYINQGDRHASMLVFIDGGVESPQFLAEGVIAEAKAFILNRDRDGIKQITEIINSYDGVDTIHLVSHGTPGSIQLGNSCLSLDTLAKYESELKSWNKELLIYGCNVATGDAGEEFVTKLHQITGANVAASTNKVGKDNWELNYSPGQTVSELAFTVKVQEQYQHSFNLSWDTDNTLSDDRLAQPEGLEFNGNFLYVTDFGGGKIEIYQVDPDTGGITFNSTFGTSGSGENQFREPLDLDFFTTLEGQTKAFVADHLNDRIVILDVDTETGALSWDTIITEELTGPKGLQILGNSLYVTDVSGANIDIYQINEGSGQLTYQDSFGSVGAGENQFSNNSIIDLDFFTTSEGEIKAFVSDRLNRRIVVLNVDTETGALSWDTANTLPNDSPNISGHLGIEVNGNLLYATDWAGSNIDIYQIDSATGAITYDSSYGSLGAGEEQFALPLDLDFLTTTAGETKAYVADARNSRIAVLDVNNIPPTVSEPIDGGITNEDAEGLFTINLLEGARDVEGEPLGIVDAAATSTNEGREVVIENIDEAGELSLDPNQFNDLADGESETITIEYNVSDGTDSVPNEATFVVEGRNDAPINTSPENPTASEDIPLEFTGDNSITIADVDGNLESTEIRVREGTLSVDENIEEGAVVEGNNSTEITLEGSQTQINNTLASLQHSSEPNFNGRPISLTITSFDDLAIADIDQIMIDTIAVNDEPTLDNSIANQPFEQPVEDIEFSFTVAENTFSDVDLNDREPDRLTYSAQMLVEGEEDSSLPEWLDFDPETLTFSGTPLNSDVGSFSVMLTATDLGGATATDTFDLEVANVNDAPTVTNPVDFQIDDRTASLSGATFNAPRNFERPEDFVAPQNSEEFQNTLYVTEDQPFEITFASDTFTDVDADDVLSYEAMLADGAPLPDSIDLTVNAEGELVLSGTPGDDDVDAGVYEIAITATDESGVESESTSFFLEVENINDAPILDLNGADEDGIDFLAEGITPGNSLMSVVDRDLTFSDLDDDTFSGAITVQLSDPYTDELGTPGNTEFASESSVLFLNSAINGFSESLTANTRGTNIARYYNSNTGTLFLFGEDSVDNFQKVLRTVEYFNNLDSGIRTDLALDFGIAESLDLVSFSLFGVHDSEILANSNVSFDADTTASISEDELVIADTAGGDTDDQIDLSFDPDNGTIRVKTNSDFSVGEGVDVINGMMEVPQDMARTISIDNMAGEDTLTVNLDGVEQFGNIFQSVVFNFGNLQSSAENMLILEGSLDSASFGFVGHNFTDEGIGASSVSSFSDNHSISFDVLHEGLESIVDELDTVQRVFSFSDAAETITLSENEIAGDNLTMIASDLGVAIFSSPDSLLVVNTQDGNDTVMVDELDSSFAANLRINAGNGNDTINGGAGDEIINGGAGKDELTGGAGDDVFVFESLTESLAAGFAFDAIEDLTIGSDAIVAPVAINAEDIRDFGTLPRFSARAASAFLAELDANEGAILEFASRDFLVINDGTAGFNIGTDAVIEITGFSGNIDDLAIETFDSLESSSEFI